MNVDAAPPLSLLADEAGEGVGRWGLVIPTTAVFVPLVALAAAQGGYFPTAWGWASVPLFWAAAVALVVRAGVALSRAESVFLAALLGLTAWTACSAAWSTAPAESVLEVERTLVYLAAALAVLFLARGGFVRPLLATLLGAVAVISAFSLATRLVPDRIGVFDGSGVYRLAQPIGYWNGLALFVDIGVMLAAGFAARARSIGARAACGALLVLFLPTLYFTFGRGAWIALGLGVVAAVAVDRRRLQLLAVLLALAPAPAVGVLLASRQHGLTQPGIALAEAAHAGHRVAIALVGLAALNALVAAVVAVAERRLHVPELVRRVFAVALVVALVAGGAIAVVGYGGPARMAKRGYDAFNALPPPPSATLNSRFHSLSGNGRAQMWRLAWDDAELHPVLGAGAGTYARYFLAHQPATFTIVQDAHGLYIETLAELGPFGLALLLVSLLAPLAVLRHARREPLVSAAVGAYVAYLVHTGADWDWELPAVTLAGLLCGCAILLAARSGSTRRPLLPPLRWATAGVAVVAAAFAAVGVIGNAALSRSHSALQRGDAVAASADARRAHSLMPWSPAPWQALGKAQRAANLTADARTSFRRALTLDGGDWSLWADLATVTSGAQRRHALRQIGVLFPQSGLVAAPGRRSGRGS